MGRIARGIALALACCALAACKVELYAEVPEDEANDMVALLISNGIDAEKGAADKGMVPVNVEDADLSTALEILRENGFPRDTFNDLGTIFAQEGLISSPLEERVRLIYGLSQTISETLTQIDGVITARVHVVLPESHPLDTDPAKATASVFLKTRPGVVDLEDKIPQIKMLVQASVEGVAYDDVVVAIFEAEVQPEMRVDGPPLAEFMGIRYTADSEDRLLMVAGGLGALLLLALGGNLFFFQRARNARTKNAVPGE